ncbi:TonB-dependent receptor [Arcticibacter sp. MXS-1]|uniref:TonB-dependent receptor n=1 Tax=Arcticibacter sp. MXS-1 TaxID=3341726 RepID=UPI0035A93683
MRITLSHLVVLFVLSGVAYAGSGKAQGVLNNTVRINSLNSSLQEVLMQIERTSDVKFVYSKNVIDLKQEVSINAEGEVLSQVLNQLLTPIGIRYDVINEQIVLSKMKNALLMADVVVTGKITDAKGEPLPGVSVKIKGTNIGVVSGVTGNYSLRIPAANASGTLVVSYLGFTTQEIALSGRTKIDVQLKEDVKALDEVVVVGYNIVKKSDVTGAVASVGAEQIRSRPVQNALQAIQGKAAGVDITSNERPGEVGKVFIRGVRSLTASSNPLYVVDGIPLSAGGIEAINPNDIEKIDILKDASATAIYGSRGANGVVLVTTKRGKNGALSLNYVGTTTIEKMYDRTEMMNSAEYIKFRRDAYGFFNPTRALDSGIFAKDPYAWRNVVKGWQNGTWDGSLVPTTDWTGMTLKTGITQDHTISASGGTEKLKGYGSFGFLKQDGTQLGQDYKRFTGKFSVDVTPVKWFSFGGNVTTTYGLQNYGFQTNKVTGPGNLYFAAQGMLPYAVPFDDEGKRINLPGGDINILNPIGEDQYNINERKVLRTLGSLYAEVRLLEGLKYRVNFGPDFYNRRNGIWTDAMSINTGGGEAGSYNEAQLHHQDRTAWTLDHLLYFDRTYGKHNMGLTLLQSSSSNRQESSDMVARNLPWTSQKWYSLNSVSNLYSFGSGLLESSLTSWMGRFNYGFNNKYLLTTSFRWDGASQLAEGHKWDFFPSVALAWRMDQESFIKPISWINMLKLRLGYGSTGNAAVESYTTKGPLSTLYYTWGSTVEPGYVSSDPSLSANDIIGMPNYELGWEHTTQWNLGVDFDLFNGRLGGTIDVYRSKTSDLLMDMAIPSVNGYVKTLANVGNTSNRGIDLSLNTVNIKTNNFNWSSTLNFSASKDRIDELSNGKEDVIANNWFIGERLGVYYDYVKAGIWQNTDEDKALMDKFNTLGGHKFKAGQIKPADLNGDFKIDANHDRKIVGHSNPNWNAGLTNTFNYKNWELSFFLYARWGFSIATGAESLQGRFAQRKLDYWTPNNPTNSYPAPDYTNASGDPFKSAMNYQEASFIKLRNASLGYNLPKSFSNKLHLSNVKIYAQALNPGLIYSKIDWIDPDLGGSTFNRGIVFGLNVGF